MVQLRWHGHTCFELRSDFVLVLDPHDGRSIGLPSPAVTADLVLISHDHFDHNQARAVKHLSTRVITGPGRYTHQGVTVRGIPAYHDDCQGAKRGPVTIYQFELEAICFTFASDLGHQLDPQLQRRFNPHDVLFVPVGGTFTLDAKGAWQVVETLQPKVIIPMHYKYGGLTFNLEQVEPFLELASCPVEKMGSEVVFEKEDLPSEQEIWLFTI